MGYKAISNSVKKEHREERKKNNLECDCGHTETEFSRIYERTTKGKVCTKCFLELLAKR